MPREPPVTTMVFMTGNFAPGGGARPGGVQGRPACGQGAAQRIQAAGAGFALLAVLSESRTASNANNANNATPAPMNIVITGSTQGLGSGYAREFLKRGHNVMVSGRKQASVDKAVSDLRRVAPPGVGVAGLPCDVSRIEDVQAL